MIKSKLKGFQTFLIVACIISIVPLVAVNAKTSHQGMRKTSQRPENTTKEHKGTECTGAKNASPSSPQNSTGNLKIELLNCTMSGTGGESMTWKGTLLQSSGSMGREQFDTLLTWPSAQTGIMNCATYTAEVLGLKAGTWRIETRVAMSSPSICNYTIGNGLTSPMKAFIGKKGCESDFEDYLSYADLTPGIFSNPADPYTFRLVIYPGKSFFSSVFINSICVKVEINGATHGMQSASKSRWAYTLDDRCPKLTVFDPQKPWQKGFEYNFTIDFDIETEQGKITHITQNYPKAQKAHSQVDHAGTIYFVSTKCNTETSPNIVYEDGCLLNGSPCTPLWKQIEDCDRDKPLSNSYVYEFEIHNLSASTQISRIEIAPFQENPANTKFEIIAALPAILQGGNSYKFKVSYKPDITDCWSKLTNVGRIKTWVINSGSGETEGPSLYIDYIVRKLQE